VRREDEIGAKGLVLLALKKEGRGKEGKSLEKGETGDRGE
jgi:hypothetical protein